MPEGIDHDTLVFTILERGGEYETVLSNPDFIESKMKAWSDSYRPVFEKWLDAINTEYAPLENYDRIEEWNDNAHSTGNDRANSSGSSNGTNTVSAYDSSALVNDNGSTASTSTSTTSDSSVDNNNHHTGRVHGNIGVTTSSKMLEEFMLTRVTWGNIYTLIAELFLHDFVIPLG